MLDYGEDEAYLLNNITPSQHPACNESPQDHNNVHVVVSDVYTQPSNMDVTPTLMHIDSIDFRT
jgi:hypothetical protein